MQLNLDESEDKDKQEKTDIQSQPNNEKSLLELTPKSFDRGMKIDSGSTELEINSFKK